ncbi:Ribonuclease H-like domain [Cinara cedri]|uniref:Ribonuclease H-like domain n=1 Tax=Cinara cedri TaxID=506608 RepID=A0A5E4NKX3_9HEMI|nr:Ribonuclease H-like domain [Cinara cedri]
MYNAVYEQVKQDIQEHAKYVSITTDSWTSIKNSNYIAVTCHFIDNECELKSYLFSCFKNSESHSSENLKNNLLAIIKKWGLENKIANLCRWKHEGCFTHSLNLGVQTALKSILETRKKVRGIVGHFKRSPQAAENLRTMQEQLGLTPLLMLI